MNWFAVMLSVIFVLLKVDSFITWNWFLVLIPMWLYDIIVITYWGLKVGLSRRYTQPSMTRSNYIRSLWRLISTLFKLTFQVLLCVYLQYDVGVRLVYVMIPLWCILLGTIIEVGIFVLGNH